MPRVTAAAADPRPTTADLAEAAHRTLPDIVAPGLRVLFCGINPGLWSGATGHHFARPGNRFWPVLHAAGFTDRLLRPSQQADLLDRGLGVTNIVRRTTASADELTEAELRMGAERVTRLVLEFRPAWLAVLGVIAYRTAFGDRRAVVGRRSTTIGGTKIWLLPNPSGRSAAYQLPALVAAFAELRTAADAGAPG